MTLQPLSSNHENIVSYEDVCIMLIIFHYTIKLKVTDYQVRVYGVHFVASLMVDDHICYGCFIETRCSQGFPTMVERSKAIGC